MLGLKLRDEFEGRRLKGTSIELTNKNQTGAIQVSAQEFLGITYPTADVLKTLEFAGPGQGLPIALRGERGQGKSHLMAALYHAFNDNVATMSWLNHWADVLNEPKLTTIKLRSGMHIISESLHRQRYKFLWDLLFEQHPHGNYCLGKWQGLGDKKTDIPSDEIILELFQNKPTVLILDEFQTWFDGLTNTKQFPLRTWAFNFIQILSEIAKEYPHLLVLVVSVRNGNTDAFQQVQRVNPIIIDFKGPTAKRDRLNLLLHRLFENRLQVANDRIAAIIEKHTSEYIRLKNIAPAEQERVRVDFISAWPYAPHLMQLLEDQVLMATHAQETRDLIRILADLFKYRGEDLPIITAADFRLDDEESGIAALLDSVANQHHSKLREKATRNLEAVLDATATTGEKVPHLEGVIAALWLRSLSDSNLAGADQSTLQIDITKDRAIDDNAFEVELSTIIENSFNIHEEGSRYTIREEENAQAKLISSARNDKLFRDGEDISRLCGEIRYVIAGSEEVANKYKVVVLPQYWTSSPWDKVDEADRPQNWSERLPLLVLPEYPEKLDARLGTWLRDNLQSKRNMVRFLLPREGTQNVLGDRSLIVLARAVYLAEKWKGQNPDYGRLQAKYQKELRDTLKVRFDKFALISNWNFQEPKNCRFHVECHDVEGSKIPEAINQQVRDNLFIPEDFAKLILSAAPNNESVGKIINELREPRPNGEDCVPWLGETEIKERIIRLCAKGQIAINVRGMEYLQRTDDESEDDAWKRMRGRLGSGKHLDETYILTPQAVPSSCGLSPGVSNSIETNTREIFQGSRPGNKESTGEIQQTGSSTDTQDDGTSSATIPRNIFDGKATSYRPVKIERTSALNLLGKTESCGIGPGTQIHSLRLQIEKLTGAQLQELLRKLPDGMTYQLDLEKEE